MHRFALCSSRGVGCAHYGRVLKSLAAPSFVARIIRPDATCTHRKLAEGHSIVNPAIEFKKLCIAANLPFLRVCG
ncbi:hypothetical protein FIBSPDRAFT_870468 [Athelia psychrophila]|uniref:Uncharacterized protein n=1 Tax=Athelia psychrophila TaxID=1759441 RepID=A0A166B510_9AGAM|nr:hypothetical protein FIBSPDRAFT_870468 [Fibularhizoctonia sp. CBS 109695]